MITEVGEDSPAEQNNLHVGDIIVKVREAGDAKTGWEFVDTDGSAEIRGPAGSRIDLLVQDATTGKLREVDNVRRAGVDALTLAPDDTVCVQPLSELEPHPGRLPARAPGRARQVG